MFRYIRAMASSRLLLQTKLNAKSEQVVEHLVKIAMFPKSSTIPHWKQEIFAFLHSVDRQKSNHKYPSEKFIYESISTMNDILDSYVDYVRDCEGEQMPLYPTDDSLLNYISGYQRWIAKELSTKGRISKDACYSKIDELKKILVYE